MAMNALVTGIAVEATGFGVDTPDTELARVKGELQPLVGILEGSLVASPFGEQSRKDQGANGNRQQRGAGRIDLIVGI